MGRHSRPEAAPSRAPWQRPVVVLAALLVVLAVVAVVLATQGSDDAGARADVQTTPAPISSTSPTPTPAPTSPTPSPAATPATSAPASTAPTPAASATPSPTPPPLLSFTVLRTAWISVTDSSGHQLVARVFRAGEKASYDGPAFTVRTGNAGGVRFVVDGKPRSLGGSGQVESFTVRG
ncbi:MAG: DUF4115 domain-containing protein [Motilibacteraceae bacterium]